jgi:hypothetical protein
LPTCPAGIHLPPKISVRSPPFGRQGAIEPANGVHTLTSETS